jgi:hypothetical protein
MGESIPVAISTKESQIDPKEEKKKDKLLVPFAPTVAKRHS